MKTIFKSLTVILTIIAGATMITLTIVGIETPIEKIIAAFATGWLVALIGANFIRIIEEDE